MLSLVRMDLEQVIKDTLMITEETQRRQAEVQKMQAEGFALHEQRMNHIELNLSEITDKLNGLIGFMNGYFRKQ